MNNFQTAFYFVTNNKLNNEIEQLFIKFKEDLEVYNDQYKLTIKSHISAWNKEFKELKQDFEKEKAKREEVYIRFENEYGDNGYALHVSGLEYFENNYDENKDKIKKKYENYLDLYSKSILVALYSLNEKYLNKICNLSAKIFEYRISLSDFNPRDYLSTPINYLRLVVNLNVEKIEKIESKLKDVQLLRNKIVHSGSRKENEIKNIVKKYKDNLKYDSLNNHIKIINKNLISNFIDQLKEFHEEIFWLLEEKQKNLIAKNSLKYFFGLIDRNIYITQIKQNRKTSKKTIIEFKISSRRKNLKKSSGRLILEKSSVNKVELINQTENDSFQELVDYQNEHNGYDLRNCLLGLTLFNKNTSIELTLY